MWDIVSLVKLTSCLKGLLEKCNNNIHNNICLYVTFHDEDKLERLESDVLSQLSWLGIPVCKLPPIQLRAGQGS